MDIVELNYLSSDAEKDRYIKSHIAIWNDSENLKYLSFTGQLFTDDMLKNWIYGLNNNSEIRYYTAIEGENVVGIIVLKVDMLNGYEIIGLGIKPEFKRKRIGNQLLQRAINNAKEMKFKSIQAIVYTDNVPMLLLTIKNGFQPYRVDTNQRYDGMNIVALKKFL